MKVTSPYNMVACFVHRIDENTISFGAVFGPMEPYSVTGIVVLDKCEGVFRCSLYKDIPVYESECEIDGDGAVHNSTYVVEYDNSMRKEVVLTFLDKQPYMAGGKEVEGMLVKYSFVEDDIDEGIHAGQTLVHIPIMME